MALEDINALIPGLVAEVLEENSAGEEGELNCVDVDVRFVSVPGVCSYDIGNDKPKDTIEEEEEEYDDNNDDNEFEEEDPLDRISQGFKY